MGERILEEIFGVWCETEANQNVLKDMDKLKKMIQAGESTDKIEWCIDDVVCSAEHSAFKKGFLMAVQVLNGKIFEGDATNEKSRDSYDI